MGSLFDWCLVLQLDVVCMTKVEVMLGKDMREATKFFCDSFSPLFREKGTEIKAFHRTPHLYLLGGAFNNMLLTIFIAYRMIFKD